MNVVILSDHYSLGGAAQALCRIAESLWRFAHPSIARIVFFPDAEASLVPYQKFLAAVLQYDETPLKRQLYRLPRKLLPKLFPRPNTPEFSAKRLRTTLKKLQPDIINVHNLHTATPWGWGPHLVEVCLEFAPVVWTLHDMWSFTGRCAYSYDCERFITGCDAGCPTPHEQPKLAPEKIRSAWLERQTIYSRHRENLVIVTPSHWLSAQARRGLFAQHRIEVIPYGVPTYLLSPQPRESARRQLGIDPAGPVLLLAAYDLTERRKGADILAELWRHIRLRPMTLLTMGHGAITVDNPDIRVRSLGWMQHHQQTALAYSAADALLHPAPVDNFPNVVLESLACGTPAIGMPIGGLPEMIRPGVSGWLADEATPQALAQAVDRAIGDLLAENSLRESCRNLAEKEYHLLLQGERYFQLFTELQQ